jgi:hypothetical protein
MDQHLSDERKAIEEFFYATYHDWGKVDFVSSEAYSRCTAYLVRKPLTVFAQSVLTRLPDLTAALGCALGRVHLEVDGAQGAFLIKIDRLNPEPAYFGRMRFEPNSGYNFVAGLNYRDEPVRLSLTDRVSPHTLISGDTGTGKSNFINIVLAQLLDQLSPQELQLLLVDRSLLTAMSYKSVPHLWRPLPNASLIDAAQTRMTDMGDLIRELELRIARCLDAQVSGREQLIAQYPDQTMPIILVVINELADLFDDQGGAFSQYLKLLHEAMARGPKLGIHVMISLQRPIRDNLPAALFDLLNRRVVFRLSNPQLSELMIDSKEASGLRHSGEGIISAAGDQTPFTALYLPEDPGADPSLHSVIARIKTRWGRSSG